MKKSNVLSKKQQERQELWEQCAKAVREQVLIEEAQDLLKKLNLSIGVSSTVTSFPYSSSEEVSVEVVLMSHGEVISRDSCSIELPSAD